ncbi:MAG: hypothetical protein ACPG4Z_06300, partial [Chitinophagales bacterium]
STNKWHTIGLAYRFYSKKRSAFAPYGNYFGYRTGVIIGNVSQYTDDRETTPLLNPIYRIQEESFFSAYAGIEFGRQFVLFERLLLDVNFRANLPLNIFFSSIGGSSSNNIKKNAHRDVLFSELFQFKIALGGLIF